MRKSLTTEEDIESLLDYVVGESFGSYYYERVRNSSNVIAMGKLLKLMIRIKGSDFSERMRIYGEIEQVLSEIENSEHIEEVNTFEWVKQVLLDAGVVKLKQDQKPLGECKIIPIFCKEDDP
jgi:hypothetical protein